MNVRDITPQELVSIINREESHFFDFKARDVAPRQIEKICVAFANADGGELVIGISEDEVDGQKAFSAKGFADLESMNSILQSLFSLNPPVGVSYEFLKSAAFSGYLLWLRIEKGANVHKTSDATVYVRQGAQSLPLKDPDRIAALGFAKGAQTFEDATLQDLKPEMIVEAEELSTFLENISPKSDPLEFCLNQNLLDNKEWHPRVAAALLFSPNPSAFVPRKCAVKITRYKTSEDDPERDHLAEQHTVEGPIHLSIKETVEVIKNVMTSVEVWTKDGLKSLEYPPEAIWETVVNAFIHRDYSISDDIQILIYDNRIEILSPGVLPGYVTVDNILEARYSRNPKLVRTLARYPDAPNKDLGEGLNTTFQKMKEWGFREPSIEVEGNYVKVTLPHARLAAPTAAIMEFLSGQATITNRQARELTGIRSENLVKIEFYKLRDEGLIERVPGLEGPKSAWRLTAAGEKKLEQEDKQIE
jgi:ATP-dependent DNA helicase RecG